MAAQPFVMVPLDMFDDKRIKARDIIVYVALASFVDGDERGKVSCAAECYPTLKDIAFRSKRSVSSVSRALRRLETAGWIRHERRFFVPDDGHTVRVFYTAYQLFFPCGMDGKTDG